MMTAESDRRPALGALLVAAGMVLAAAFAWLSRPSPGAEKKTTESSNSACGREVGAKRYPRNRTRLDRG